MNKLWRVALAASAALVPMAAAQAQPMAPRAPRPVAMPAPPHAGMPVPHGPRHFGHRMGHVRHFPRIERGGFIPPFWFGPQFHVQNWGMHGFPQPVRGRRWVRYYDDALLIDDDGRVHDGRYGWDWGRDGERWAEDENGIPAYVGDGDFEPREWDYEWAERWDRGDYAEDDRRGYASRHGGPAPHRCGNPCTRTYSMPPSGGYGHPGYGYGYYGWGPVIVTETIVTTAPVVEQVTTYEYIEEEVRAAPRRKVRRPCNCPRPAPRPRPGERG